MIASSDRGAVKPEEPHYRESALSLMARCNCSIVMAVVEELSLW